MANAKLYDMLVMHLADDPLILMENRLNQGFEVWRALFRRYDPVGEQFVFDQMTSLLRRDRCKDIGDLPGAIERWTRDLSTYERKTGKTLQNEWRVPIMLSGNKNITTFAQELVVYANDLKHEQSRGRGASPMDVDNLSRGEPAYTAAEWAEWEYEDEVPVDWVGKGKKGGGKGQKGGKGGGKGQ